MISEKMKDYVKNSSAIRAMFEEGRRMASLYGEDKVYDFSLGNPNVPSPIGVEKAVMEILKKEKGLSLHGYMNNSGFLDVRETIGEAINRKHKTAFCSDNIIMTVGAAGGLNVVLKTLLNPKDEVIVFAPFFGEYKSYIENYDGVLTIISPNIETFWPNLKELEEKINSRTKAVIINSPNNPTGVVYSEEFIKRLARILEKKEEEYKTSIYLISDEPYRELVYDGMEVPYLTNYYKNTIVAYSFSKALSIPGERIGYLVFPKELDDFQDMVDAANVATRILGFVNAPSLFQKVVARCINEKTDVSYYDRNRRTLYEELMRMGVTCVKPQGAFYLFVKSPDSDERNFCQRAKKYHILMVPGSSFSCSGYVRIAYCVAYETIVNALPKFEELIKEYR